MECDALFLLTEQILFVKKNIKRMGESKYELALEVVANWVDEMMRSGYGRTEALETLLLVLKSGALGAVHEQVKEYEVEIEAVLKSQLGQTH